MDKMPATPPLAKTFEMPRFPSFSCASLYWFLMLFFHDEAKDPKTKKRNKARRLSDPPPSKIIWASTAPEKAPIRSIFLNTKPRIAVAAIQRGIRTLCSDISKLDSVELEFRVLLGIKIHIMIKHFMDLLRHLVHD